VQRFAGANGRMSHMRSVLSCARRAPHAQLTARSQHAAHSSQHMARAPRVVSSGRRSSAVTHGSNRSMRKRSLFARAGPSASQSSAQHPCCMLCTMCIVARLRSRRTECTWAAWNLHLQHGRSGARRRGAHHGIRQQVRAVRGHAQAGDRVGVALQRHRDLRLPQVPHLRGAQVYRIKPTLALPYHRFRRGPGSPSAQRQASAHPVRRSGNSAGAARWLRCTWRAPWRPQGHEYTP